jgi:hemerythrin-like metal-binding protein
MKHYEWREDYSVGHELLDDDHKKLFALIDRMRRIVQSYGTRGEVERVLNELYEYTDYHFQHEEEFLKQVDFPAFEAHKKRHAHLKREVETLLHTYNTMAERTDPDDYEFEKELYRFLNDWLVNHILGEDKLYARHVERSQQ